MPNCDNSNFFTQSIVSSTSTTMLSTFNQYGYMSHILPSLIARRDLVYGFWELIYSGESSTIQSFNFDVNYFSDLVMFQVGVRCVCVLIIENGCFMRELQSEVLINLKMFFIFLFMPTIVYIGGKMKRLRFFH